MTEQEHLELLLAVVRVAPKELCAGIDVEYYTAWFDVVWDPEKPAELRLDNDMIAAQACFAMLDAMESDGHICVLTRECEETTEPGWQRETVRESGLVAVETMDARAGRIPKNHACQVVSSGKPSKEIAYGYGSTRAEAISRAFVAVFGSGA